MRKFSLLMAFALLFAGVSTTLATKPHPGHKVAICHRTASDTNPYVLIEVDEASLPAHFNNLPGHPAKEWKSAGSWNGAVHVAGDLKSDYLYVKGESECEPGVEETETPEVTPTPDPTSTPEITPDPTATPVATPQATPSPTVPSDVVVLTPEPTLPATDTDTVSFESGVNLGIVAIIAGLLMLGAGLISYPRRKT